MKYKKRHKHQPLHPPKGRKPPPMTKLDRTVWVLLGIATMLALTGTFLFYRSIRIRWFLSHGAMVLGYSNSQIILGTLLGVVGFFIVYGIFAVRYYGQPIWGIPGHHYGRTSVQTEVYPLLGPKREREELRLARLMRKEQEQHGFRWYLLAVLLLFVWMFAFCLVPRNRIMEDGSVRSARMFFWKDQVYPHTQTDRLWVHVGTSKQHGSISCFVRLTASGEEFEFSLEDFRDAKTLALVAARYPKAEIDDPNLLNACSQQERTILSGIFPQE